MEKPTSQVIALRDPGFAAVLAWLWPGAGHLYQGRIAKGLLLMICILGVFLYGLYLGQGRVVFIYGAWKGEAFRWPYLCQVAAGLPALPAIVRRGRVADDHDLTAVRNWYIPPRDAVEMDSLHKSLHRFFELGTVFTMIAGLLNVLAIYDAWGGPAYATERKEEESEVPSGLA